MQGKGFEPTFTSMIKINIFIPPLENDESIINKLHKLLI
jgi:hypothetical protein